MRGNSRRIGRWRCRWRRAPCCAARGSSAPGRPPRCPASPPESRTSGRATSASRHLVRRRHLPRASLRRAGLPRAAAPMAAWAGTIHVLRRPKTLLYTESTSGAHSSLSENGHETIEKVACAVHAGTLGCEEQWDATAEAHRHTLQSVEKHEQTNGRVVAFESLRLLLLSHGHLRTLFTLLPASTSSADPRLDFLAVDGRIGAGDDLALDGVFDGVFRAGEAAARREGGIERAKE